MHRYFEDFSLGWTCTTPTRTLDREAIVEFARQWDPQRFHTDEEAARQTPFGGLIASGWHTAATAMRLMCDAYLNDSACIGSPGIEQIRFLLPVRPGDELRLRAEVIEARRSASRPDRGIVRWSWDVLNQRDQTVLSMIGTQLFLLRPAQTPAT